MHWCRNVWQRSAQIFLKFVYVHKYIYIYMCVCVLIHIYIWECVYVYIWEFLYIYIYTYIYTHIYIYVREFVYVCVYIYICVCVYIYIYVYTQPHKQEVSSSATWRLVLTKMYANVSVESLLPHFRWKCGWKKQVTENYRVSQQERQTGFSFCCF